MWAVALGTLLCVWHLWWVVGVEQLVLTTYPMQVRQQLYYNYLQDSLLQLPDSLHLVQELVVLQPGQLYLHTLYVLLLLHLHDPEGHPLANFCHRKLS